MPRRGKKKRYKKRSNLKNWIYTGVGIALAIISYFAVSGLIK